MVSKGENGIYPVGEAQRESVQRLDQDARLPRFTSLQCAREKLYYEA